MPKPTPESIATSLPKPAQRLRQWRPASADFRVLSLNERASSAQPDRIQPQFEVMVRHLFHRMLNNDSFGDDAAARITQLAYAIALPGILVALFLFPAYHGLPPHPHERTFWSQACDHLFYITYSFVILGTAITFQWDLLFPDLLDIYVLTSLPISRVRLLLGRLTALAIFLALVQLGTSGLGNLFFPGVADLRTGFFRHVFAHFAAVSLAALCAAASLITLQAAIVCLPARIASRISSLAKTLSIITLLTTLFLFPLISRYLSQLLATPTRPVLCFPPFWFLGIYETALWGAHAQPIFHQLAHIGLAVTASLLLAGALLYPIAYTLRTRQLMEGAATQRKASPLARITERALHTFILRTPPARATFHFAAQTLARLPRLHLYLSMYAGLGLALILSGLIAFRIDGTHIHPVLSPAGIRITIPIVAFWTVAGLRTALASPLGRAGSWLFRVIGGSPTPDELSGPTQLVALIASTLTLGAPVILFFLEPASMRNTWTTAGQFIVAAGLALTLTDIFFLNVRTIPFTATLVKSPRELPFILVRYLVIFPAFALTVVAYEPWIEASAAQIFFTCIAFAATHILLVHIHERILQRAAPQEDLLFVGLGLRED
jgi:hypothetical protein